MAEILDDLTDVFREVFNDNELIITPETTAQDIEGWDSFSHINLIMAIEMKFHITFTQKEIYDFNNIGELVNRIQSKVTR